MLFSQYQESKPLLRVGLRCQDIRKKDWNNSFAKLCILVPSSLVHLEFPHESHWFKTWLSWAKGYTFSNLHCSEPVDSHELFILCHLMGERTAHLLGSHYIKKKKSKYITDAPEDFILGGIYLCIQTVHTSPTVTILSLGHNGGVDRERWHCVFLMEMNPIYFPHIC